MMTSMPVSRPGHKPQTTQSAHARRQSLRSSLLLISSLLPLWWLTGCASPSPPLQWLVLGAAPPLSTASTSAPAVSTIWQLMLPVRVPDYLDRDSLLVPRDQAGLLPLPGVRWAEPLRESVPRLLRQDLASLLGEARVWTAPLPPGLRVQRQLRVELLAFESNRERTAVVLRARWAMVDPSAAAAPQVESAVLTVPSVAADADSLASAHRLALWRLAERIAASSGPAVMPR